jgi:3-dehydroquinate synthase
VIAKLHNIKIEADVRDMGIVRVELGDRSYDIHVGTDLLDQAGVLVSSVCKGKSAAIITNPKIGRLYADRLAKSLQSAGIQSTVIAIPAGERYKTLRTVAKIYEKLLDSRLDRGSIVVGLGGGVVGDVAGFVSATYLRGVDFVQVPTSLLAQVDASVGGKTGVNLSRGKNLVGAFYQPKLVLVDTSTLTTLPKVEFRSGLAEVIKHAVIRDSNYFCFLEQNMQRIKRLDPTVLEPVVQRSCEIKAEVVCQDEKESGLRRILNYGHTVGHAIEALTGYTKLKHGEAVAIGMVTAALVSDELGVAEPGVVERIIGILKSAGLPYKLPEDISKDEIINAMGLDKKVVHGRLHAVLLRKIGSVYVADDVQLEAWSKALAKQAVL